MKGFQDRKTGEKPNNFKAVKVFYDDHIENAHLLTKKKHKKRRIFKALEKKKRR